MAHLDPKKARSLVAGKLKDICATLEDRGFDDEIALEDASRSLDEVLIMMNDPVGASPTSSTAKLSCPHCKKSINVRITK